MAFRRDPADGRVFVPKKGGGVGMNYAHPIAWAILISMTVVPAVVVIGVTIALFV